MNADNRPLLSVRGLSIAFGPQRRRLFAVRDVSFDIARGETLGLVGESGSGKTSIGRAIVRVYQATAGEILYKGQRISGRIDRELDARVTREIQMIFQDPMASLNERAKVEYIVSEGLLNCERGLKRAERQQRVMDALMDVGLLPEFAGRFPHEFSGGQRQRIGIARALVMRPEFVVADEPISSLDVSIRAQVLNLLAQLQKKHGLTFLFISHDLSVMRFICDRIAVIHKGSLVEMAETEQLFRTPLHPYTRALLSAVPMPNPAYEKNKTLEPFDEKISLSAGFQTWQLAEPGHHVLCDPEELRMYREQCCTAGAAGGLKPRPAP